MMQKEYLIGGLIVVGILVIRAIVNLFMTPSLNTIAKTCSKCIPQMGEDDKLTIWGYEAAGEYTASKAGMSDGSYYVSRVEAYCRAARINYTKLASQGGSENPRGKVPFANIEGTMVDDSAKIIAGIQKKYNVNLDKDLTPQQLATGHLIRETLHGSLYWVGISFSMHSAWRVGCSISYFSLRCFIFPIVTRSPPILCSTMQKVEECFVLNWNMQCHL